MPLSTTRLSLIVGKIKIFYSAAHSGQELWALFSTHDMRIRRA